jgi:hypothetical protein
MERRLLRQPGRKKKVNGAWRNNYEQGTKYQKRDQKRTSQEYEGKKGGEKGQERGKEGATALIAFLSSARF